MYSLINVLCWLWNIYEGSELPNEYFVTNTKHCITYLALTQLFPMLVSHPEMYTLCSNILLHFVEESFISFFSHGRDHMGQMDFIGLNNILFLYIRWTFNIYCNCYRCSHTMHEMPVQLYTGNCSNFYISIDTSFVQICELVFVPHALEVRAFIYTV